MKNNIDNSLNFRGSYLINYKNTLPEIRTGFEKAIGNKKRQIFNDFNGKQNEVLYVLKNSKDYDAAEFIKRNGVKFKYMPNVDTQLRFDEYYPEEVVKYIAEQKPDVISKLSELMKYVKANRVGCRARKDSQIPFYKKVLDKLCIPIEGERVRDSRGVTKVIDTRHDGLVVLSPQKSNGISYMYVKPANDYAPTVRLMVDENANILAKFDGVDQIKLFKERFNEAIKEHMHISK